MKRGGPLKRTPLARGTKSLRRTRLAPMSAKRRVRVIDRRVAVAMALARDGGCVLRVSVDHHCSGPLDGHEPLPRSRGGDPYDPDQIVTVCRALHDELHANPAWARTKGLLR